MQQQEGSTAETGQRSRPHTARRCEAGADMRHRDAASGEWATGGAKLLAQATAAQLGMLITTTRWTGPTCCWKTVAMAGEWTAAGTATGRAVLMVPVGAVAMRRRAGGCSWRSRGSREPRDGLGGDSALCAVCFFGLRRLLLRFAQIASSLFYLAPIIKHAWANLPPADGRKARRVKILGPGRRGAGYIYILLIRF
jgi:hypothetical protein